MSQVDKFEINLEHDIDEQYQYEPGEMLRGHVVLRVNGPTKVKAIVVQIKGEATVSWEDEVDSSKKYHAEETYIDHATNLLQAPSGDSITIERGQHTYPIKFILPPNLPSSFIGKYGSVTYVVKATLKEDKKFGLSTMITSEPFLVLRKLNLDENPELQRGVEKTADKRLWGAVCFCISGKVSATLTMNKTGHLPGEDIFMDAEISNSSPRTIRVVQAAIIMHSKFNARSKVRSHSQMVNKKRDDWEMDYGEGRRWKNVRLTIPPYIPESRLDGCDIIDISYELLFKVEIAGDNELQISVPVVVGTGTSDDTPRKPATQEELEEDDTFMANGDHMNGDANANDDDMEDIELNETDKDFRHPMEPGTIRKNPIFINPVVVSERL